MTEHWTEADLDALPTKDGVRLRGVDITRLETFCDAAFAFALTLLVIGEQIPKSYDDLILALKGVPAFAASFALIASLWWAHRTWSRRYGLEDRVTTLLSLAMVFVMLIYVYPLKMVFSGLAFWVSGGYFPAGFELNHGDEMLGIFVIYGLGHTAQTGMLALLHVRALGLGRELGLSEVERIRTRQQITAHYVMAATGIASALWAAFAPQSVAMFAGFWYTTLAVAMPVIATRYERKVERAAPTAG